MKFEAAMTLMRKHDPQLQEEGFELLRPVAAAHVDDLITEFNREQDHGLRCWLLELIGLARSETALPLFADLLTVDDESIQHWARQGLELLNSKEARTLLWQHQH